MERFVFATDLHGIEQDARSVKALAKFTADFKPDIRIFGGDLWNFAALRRGADENEKKIRLREDFDAGIEFLSWFRPDVFLLGNHDVRLWDAIARDRVERRGWLAELSGIYVKKFNEVADSLKIRVMPYEKKKGIFKYKGLSFAHGFGTGKDLTQNMAEVYGNVLIGHGHRFERIPVVKEGGNYTGYQSGALCVDDMDWTRADLGAMKQEQGWAYGVIANQPEVFFARVQGGKALVATKFEEV